MAPRTVRNHSVVALAHLFAWLIGSGCNDKSPTTDGSGGTAHGGAAGQAGASSSGMGGQAGTGGQGTGGRGGQGGNVAGGGGTGLVGGGSGDGGVGGDGGAGADGGVGGDSGAGAQAGTGAGSGGEGGTGGAKVCTGDRIIDDDAKFAALVTERCSEIFGVLQISNPTQTSLVGLETIQKAISVRITGTQLTNLRGLDGLAESKVIIEATQSLTSLEGLENVTKVSRLALEQNQALKTLAGLERVSKVSPEFIMIDGNAQLETLGPLLEWAPDVVEGPIFIYSNPLLPQCQVDAFDSNQTQPDAACATVGAYECINNNGPNNCRTGRRIR